MQEQETQWKYWSINISDTKTFNKFRKHNGDDILISSGTSNKGNVYSASMSLEEAVRKDNDLKGKVGEMVLMLRKEIFRAKKVLLPKYLKLSDIEKGEVELPELISIFIQNLQLSHYARMGYLVKFRDKPSQRNN